MKLRQQSFVLIACAVLGASLLMLGGVYWASLREFDQLERDAALRAARRAGVMVGDCADRHAQSVHQIAHMPGVQKALVEGNEMWLRSLISDEVGHAAGWLAVILQDANGTLRMGKRYPDGVEPAKDLSPAEMERMLKAWAVPMALSEKEVRGLVVSDERILFVATKMVAGGNGEVAGRVIAARALSEPDVLRMQALVDGSVTVGLDRVEAGSRAEGTIYFWDRGSDGGLIGGAVLYDLRGDPVAVVRTGFMPGIREHSFRFVLVVVGVLFFGTVTLCVLIDRFLIRSMIGRLQRMSAGLVQIHRGGNLAERLAVEGRDEIATLALEANRLLGGMEGSQRALERVNAEMQQRVAERTAALAAANAALEADIAQRTKAEHEREQLRGQLMRAHRMEAVGTLAGGIAHDFNNILTGILGHAQLLAADCPPGDPAEAHIRQIVAAAERASALVKQILAFSRQTPGERKIVPVGQVAKEALALLRAALPSGSAIRCVTDEGNDLAEADPTQLHQVFMNLGTNAGHAIGPRGGDLEIRIERARVEQPRLQLKAGDYVMVSVRDTGCGMKPEVMDRIFDPFFSTKPVNQGTGLGLAVVHGIVTDHGGSIDVQSKEGEGSCFRIWLPAARRAKVVADSRPPMGLPTRGTERVLLVDDEDLVLGVLGKGLQRLGYAVTAESSGIAALERFERNPDKYDVVITDQTMPQMSGLELSAAIKRINPRVPVILATGYSPEMPDRDPASLGLAAVVGKPIQFTELAEKIRIAMAMTRN